MSREDSGFAALLSWYKTLLEIRYGLYDTGLGEARGRGGGSTASPRQSTPFSVCRRYRLSSIVVQR